MNIQYYYADNDLLRSWKISSANTHCGLKFHLRCWWSLLLFPWLAHIWLLGVQCWMRELCWHLCQEPSPPARLALLKHASGAPNRAWHFGYPWAVRWWKAWAMGTGHCVATTMWLKPVWLAGWIIQVSDQHRRPQGQECCTHWAARDA